MKRQNSSYIIENVEVWNPIETRPRAKVWIQDGQFRGYEVDGAPAGTEKIDGQGHVLLPAGVDAQCHLRVPGQAHKEKPGTGLLAALKGGYCALLTMPNTTPTIDCVEVLQQGQAEVAPFEKEYSVRVFWSASITKRLNSADVVHLEELSRAGVRAFTNDGLGVEESQVMDKAFARLEKLSLPLLQHAEFLGHGGSLAPGPVQAKLGAVPYPAEPEWKMVDRDLRELRKHPKARYHVLHVSCAKTIELVKQAKKEGLLVTAEVSPHHLYFNCETIDPENRAFKMNPPIRSPEDQAALWQGLANGDLDFVATDHAPHEVLMKTGSFNKVAFGTLGLETTIPVLLDGLKKGHLTSQRLVQVFATRPAEFLRLPDGLGDWKVGAPFHGILLDVNGPAHTWAANDFASLSKNSCFIGATLPGKLKAAFHQDQIFKFA